MPKLNILQHKSYHPYLEKNKQRVREDEARAAAEELAIEQARLEGASVARLNELRRRAGSPSFQSQTQDDSAEDNLPSTSSTRQGEGQGDNLLERHRRDKARQEKRERKAKERLDFEWPSETARKEARRKERRAEAGEVGREGEQGAGGKEQGESSRDRDIELYEPGGHINLFADLEQAKPAPTLAEIAKRKKEQEADMFTMYLGRPDKETKPWYTDRKLRRYEEREGEGGEDAEERRQRDRRKDQRSKHRHDPLTSISTLLPKPAPSRSHAHQPSAARTPAEARAARETSERSRALALIAKAKADKERAARGRWDDTPSSAAGGRSWAEDFEREKDRAGHRFYGGGGGRGGVSERGRMGGRSWEV